MDAARQHTDVVMLGTFAAWKLGTLQARALPMASELRTLGVSPVIVTTPWDMPSEAGIVDVVDSVPIVNTRGTSPVGPFNAVLQQIQWVRKLRPSIVHVFKPKGFGGLAGRALSGSFPLIVDSDDWEGDGGWNQAAGYPQLQQRAFQIQEQDLLRNADHVTAASTLLFERARRLRAAGGTGAVHRIENGLTSRRLEDLAAGRRLPPSRIDPPVVVLYSRFAEFEPSWLPMFVNALDNMVRKSVTIRIVGDAPPLPARLWGADLMSVEAMGYVSYDSIPSILGDATLAVYPYRDSLITRSKQSVKLLELMAAGCPIVASDVGDIAPTVSEAGICIDGARPELFARTVAELLDAPGHLDAMSAKATARVRSRYGFEPLAKRLLEVYRSAGLT